MRTAEQFFDEQIISASKLPKERRRYSYWDVIKLSEVYGRQEWNAAIKEAAKHATVKEVAVAEFTDFCGVNRACEYVVDKKSITDLMK